MKTHVEELPESKVRLEVEVPEADVKHAMEHAASDLAGSIRVPGFRRGKVPTQVVVARMGREAVWSEAVRSHIGSWFWNAAVTSGIRPIAEPEVEYEGVPDDDDTFHFTATVSVLRKPEVGDWSGLEVPAAEAEVPDDLVERELDAIRATVGELAPVTGRPVQEGDTVVVDIVGEETGAQRDYVVEVGEGRLVDEIEQALGGMSSGETREVELAVGEEPHAAKVDVTVKEIKERVLPDLDDELARSASEFDTLAELRADLEQRLREQLEAELETAFRENAVDALVAATPVDDIEPLVERRTAELLNGLARSLAGRGLELGTYLQVSGQTQEDVIARLRAQADQAVRRELILDAVADKLGVEVSDEEVEELVRGQAEAEGEDPEAMLAALRERGIYDEIRGDLRMRKALDEVAAGVKKIPVGLAEARERLWTPEKERAGTGLNIWTPGSEEARTQ
ncbi:MAG TPA: trigger factor [Gaiellaceae bacterium]